MSPLIETPEEADRLLAVARSWKGTPWAFDGCIKGVAVNCAELPGAALREYGLPVPELRARRGLSKSQVMPYMIEWFASRSDLFAEVGTEEIRPGDLLLFNFGLGHLGLAVNSDEILHAIQDGGTNIVAWRDDRIGERLVKVYRPLKQI